MYEFYAPGERAPIDDRGGSWLAKAARGVTRFLGGPANASNLEPRKGGGEQVEENQRLLNVRRETGQERDHKPRRFIAPPAALKQLADADDIIFAIRRTLRNAIGELEWKIVPDLDAIKDDLARWASVVAAKIALPGLPIDFVPDAISPQIYTAAIPTLADLVWDLLQNQGVDPSDLSANHRFRAFFENLVVAHDAIARSHISQVKELFDRPNPSAESSFRAWSDLIIDAVTLYDSGCIVKNPTLTGKLGELYTVPGEQIEIYRNKDRSTPQPPYIAYHWIQEGIIKAFFNNVELVHVMANPQETGYGMSPIEVLISNMVGTRYADAYLIDWYMQNNMPFFVFDLGPNVTNDERTAVENAWDQRVSRGKHRGIFVANKDGVKGFMPMPTASNKDADVMAQLKFWANRKCAAYGLSLNDIGFTEDLHRTTAETQADLTQSRGIESLARVLEGYFNGEIVKGQMWMRSDPEDPAQLEGKMVPCFPFRDVRFQFFSDETEARLRKAQQWVPLVASGIATINEARRELVLPNVPGGDEAVVFTAGSVKVRDLPDLPGPQEAAGLLPMGGGDADSDLQGGQQPALPGGQQAALGKGVDALEKFARNLANIVEGS